MEIIKKMAFLPEEPTAKSEEDLDELAIWVVKTVGLPQYKDAFRDMFGASKLSHISTLSTNIFRRGLYQMIMMIKIGPVENGCLHKFAQAHIKLVESFGM